ncbi:MAG TPA: cyclodeaminase/cyclohydrolase family protein [Vicinamibacterales bacterium]|nr:cyclodeaminase/cyclohydrolase family protein [Vicinamibacterales bacterium]
MSLIDRSVRDLLTAFSSSDPTPGGGSAAALSSAIGASLLMMVAGLPKTRTGSDDDRARLTAAGAVLADLRDRLTEAVDADTAAYDHVVAAYKMPKMSADEQRARKAAIQRALREATDVPLGVVRLSAAALVQAALVAAHGHKAAGSDVGVAIALLRAGLRGARLNVEINVGSLTDAEYTSSVTAEINRLGAEAARSADEADALL